MDRDLKQVVAVFAVVVSFGGGYFLCKAENKNEIEVGQKFIDFAAINDEIGEYAYASDDDSFAVENAVNAYYSGLGDKYFSYSVGVSIEDTEEYINSSDMLRDNGFVIEATENGNMKITTVEKGSYAEKQGLKADDIIVQIDDTVLSEVGFKDGGRKILGKSGTECDIVLMRNNKTIQIHYVRKHEKSVENNSNGNFEMLGKVCYIDYNDFFNGCKVFQEAYSECDESADSYIIDLRDNSGGETAVSLEALGNFIGERKIGCEYYTSGKTVELFSKGKKIFDKPVVVLVNGKTASAAEIFTGAMMQYCDNAVVIGETTFGKGIFQIQKRLDNTAMLKYTAGYFTVGSWKCWQGVGITPDIVVEMDSQLIGTDEDIQLEAAIKLLNGEQID